MDIVGERTGDIKQSTKGGIERVPRVRQGLSGTAQPKVYERWNCADRERIENASFRKPTVENWDPPDCRMKNDPVSSPISCGNIRHHHRGAGAGIGRLFRGVISYAVKH